MNHAIKIITHAPHLAPKAKAKAIGLGDVVALIANPIAKVSDRLLGTRIVGCGGCQKRREALNQMVPDVNPFK